MSTEYSTFGTTPKHVASCGYVETPDKFALMFWSDTLARDGACHSDAHLLKAACRQVVAKTVKGLWTARSENICQYHVKVLRHSNFRSVPFCRICGIR